MLPEKRWTAGVEAITAPNASRSIAAMLAASGCPQTLLELRRPPEGDLHSGLLIHATYPCLPLGRQG